MSPGGLGLTHTEARSLTLPQVWNLFRGFDTTGKPVQKGARAVKAAKREKEDVTDAGARIRRSLAMKRGTK